MRILLVDDDPNLARALAKGLRAHAYAVDVASDSDAALLRAGASSQVMSVQVTVM